MRRRILIRLFHFVYVPNLKVYVVSRDAKMQGDLLAVDVRYFVGIALRQSRAESGKVKQF